MKNMSYKCVIVALVCSGAFLLAINQLSFALLSINQDFNNSDYIPISNNMEILTVKMGVCLIVVAAIIFIVDILVSISNSKNKN